MAAAGGALVAVLVAALPHIVAFNIHPAPHRVLTHGGTPSFGHQVLPLDGARVLVGAPAEVGEGRGGRLFQCRVEDGECQELELGAQAPPTHMGMALARAGNDTIACGPGLTHECHRFVYTSGRCLVLDPLLRPRHALAPGYQACLPSLVDLVFLFDGSNSINAEQFGAVRDFMVDVMEKLGNSSIRFGAVQFSAGVQPHFTLADFAARPRPRELLQGLHQLRGLTDTFAAIAYVTHSIFTPARGARPGARRVLIIITDGDATDEDEGAVQAAEEGGITRYVIGVGNNFNTPDTRLYLSQFASRPSAEFVKVLDSFEKLRGLFHDLQAKIYDIEGTGDLNRFHLELCSSGMSVEKIHGRWVTGAVGADNWAGGLVELAGEEENETFVANPALEENGTDAYLGYALAALRVPGHALVAAGAPRHRHVGAVVLFEVPKTAGTWRVLDTLPGEQVGSYFGAALCALERGGGGAALLVGAPTHYDGRRGGRVHVYRWHQDRLEVSGELQGAPGHPLGRFGASLGVLGDLDGDTWPEVAVGAPLEDDGGGAVYIFPGGPGGAGPRYTQRLTGGAVAPGRRFLGRALGAGRDLTGDGLEDLAVGLEGHVVLLRSRPVLSITPHVTVDPAQIPSRPLDCPGGAGVTVNVTVCGVTRRHPPAGDHVTPVSFRLEVEPQRARGRGSFGAGQRQWEGLLPQGAGPRCRRAELKIPPCLEDSVAPLRLSVTFALPPSPTPGPALHPDTPPLWIEIPFERACGADGLCEADLGVRGVPGGPALVGVPGAELGVGLRLRNAGDDAFGAAVGLRHPPGLELRWARARQAGAPVSITCWAPQVAVGQPWGLSCNISRPVLRAGWQVTVELMFDIHPNASWGDAVGLTATVSSDNEPPGTLGDNEASWEVPVRYALSLVATCQDDSTPYVNFTSRHPQAKPLQHRYRLETLLPPPHGSPLPLVTAFVLLPHTLPHGVTVADARVEMEPGGPCVAVGQEEEEDDVGQELRRSIAETCSTPGLRPFRCSPRPLPPAATIHVTAELRPPPAIQGPARPRFCSALRLTLAPPRFDTAPQFLRAQGVTEVELVPPIDPRPGYVGGGAGGLLLLLLLAIGLFKCGFFKRNYRERLEQEGAGPAQGAGPEEGEGPEEGDTPP